MRSARPCLTSMAALCLCACPGSEAVAPRDDTPAAAAALTTIQLTPAVVTVETGSAQLFQAQVLDQYGQPFAATLTWVSDAVGTATVDGQGTARALAPGGATITARAGSVSGSATLTSLDTHVPAVTVGSPSSGSTVEGSVTFSVVATDNHVVSRLALAVDGDTVQTLAPAQKTGTYPMVWDASAAAPGAHTASVTAWDASGNHTTVALSLSVTPPEAAQVCTIYPADNPWNTDISAYPVKEGSDQYLERLSNTWRLSFSPALPTNVIDRVKDGVPMVNVSYSGQGDPGPMPIPFDAGFQVKDPSKLVVEDNHLVVFDQADCMLYELWSVTGPNPDSSWAAGNGSIFDLSSNALRPDHKASSAASGLPVFVGLARADEVRSGAIRHALAIPATLTFEGFIHPATTLQLDDTYERKVPLVCATAGFPFTAFCDKVKAGTYPLASPWNAPMGLRLRLKADFDLSGFSGEALIFLRAAKTYGLIVSDGSGTAGMLKGEKVKNPAEWDWSTSINKQLASVPITAFEVVETGPVLR